MALLRSDNTSAVVARLTVKPSFYSSHSVPAAAEAQQANTFVGSVVGQRTVVSLSE